VKRSELVNDPDDDDLDLADDADAGADAGASAAPSGAAPAPAATPAAGAVSTEAVVAALESLTGVVGMLAAQVTEKARPMPPKRPPPQADPAADDGDPTDAEDPAEADPEADSPEPPRRGDKRPPPRGQRKSDAPLADLRAQLDRIEASLAGRTVKRAPAAPTVAQRLDEISASLASLTTTIGGQAGRLAKVERTVGAPASRPVETRPAGDEAVSWPLDINAPRDRTSVAKDLSFHDA
jgi:hypothetical protein